MAIQLKTREEIEIMVEGGQKLAAIIDAVKEAVKPGITTQALDELAAQLIEESGGQSSFKGFHDYPAVSCLSVNDEVVHGLPGARILKEGDLIGIDIGLRYKGYCTDSAVTVPVGKISQEASELLAVTNQSLDEALAILKPGILLGDIGSVIQQSVESHDFGVVRDLTGHGIGRNPHEEPAVPNFGKPGTGLKLQAGMVLAIEPMVTAGRPTIEQLDDGWTIVTRDHSLAAHVEHTIAIAEDGYRVLTALKA